MATTGLCKEGLDCPRLDALLIATPFTNAVEQAVGRVQREHPDKPRPVVVDLWDDFSVFDGFHHKRCRFYASGGFEQAELAPSCAEELASELLSML